MTLVHPVAPNIRMLTYCEALVVDCLHLFSDTPDENGVVEEVEKDINNFLQSIETQRYVFANRTMEGEIVCYSNISKRPLDKNVALDLLAQENTSDLLIYGNDLLYGDRYPANLLPNVIKNAKAIIRNNPSILRVSTSTSTKGLQNNIVDHCSVFKAMDKLTADELRISFVGDNNESGLAANNMLEITARGETKRVALAALNLVDRHTGNLNEQCGTLLGIALMRKLPSSEANKKKISRLRKLFRDHFGIIDDPFERYRKGAGWEPRFKIFDKRGAAEKRAENEARRKTDSFEELNEKGIQFVDTTPIGESLDTEDDDAENDDTEDDDADKWIKAHDIR